jgi:hypothetical protein
MDLDDLSAESRVGVAAAELAALILSPPLRRLLRRSAIAGLTGLLTAGNALAGTARRLATEGQPGDGMDPTFVNELVTEARQELARQGR